MPRNTFIENYDTIIRRNENSFYAHLRSKYFYLDQEKFVFIKVKYIFSLGNFNGVLLVNYTKCPEYCPLVLSIGIQSSLLLYFLSWLTDFTYHSPT